MEHIIIKMAFCVAEIILFMVLTPMLITLLTIQCTTRKRQIPQKNVKQKVKQDEMDSGYTVELEDSDFHSTKTSDVDIGVFSLEIDSELIDEQRRKIDKEIINNLETLKKQIMKRAAMPINKEQKKSGHNQHKRRTERKKSEMENDKEENTDTTNLQQKRSDKNVAKNESESGRVSSNPTNKKTEDEAPAQNGKCAILSPKLDPEGFSKAGKWKKKEISQNFSMNDQSSDLPCKKEQPAEIVNEIKLKKSEYHMIYEPSKFSNSLESKTPTKDSTGSQSVGDSSFKSDQAEYDKETKELGKLKSEEKNK